VFVSRAALSFQELNFHLTIHNSFRPLEGFFIDMKTRFPSLSKPEQLRKHVCTKISLSFSFYEPAFCWFLQSRFNINSCSMIMNHAAVPLLCFEFMRQRDRFVIIMPLCSLRVRYFSAVVNDTKCLLIGCVRLPITIALLFQPLYHPSSGH